MTAVIVDGRALAAARGDRMRAFITARNLQPVLTALTVAPNVPTQQFLKIKKRVAEEIGVHMHVVEMPLGVSAQEVQSAWRESIAVSHGVVLQLPLPAQYDVNALLETLPRIADPDCLGGEATAALRSAESVVLPPVVSALRALCEEFHIARAGARVVVVGQGRLVGAPAALWFEREGAQVLRLTVDSADIATHTRSADIIVLGAGVPSLLTPEMVRDDGSVVIFDAGTSEDGGKVVGDADPQCAAYARLMTPVPGGIGPLAVAELFANVLRLQFDYTEGK